jgi:hypothetical protein
MLPDRDKAEFAAGDRSPLDAGLRPSDGAAAAHGSMIRLVQLVATIKAEREAGCLGHSAPERAEPSKLITLLRQFVAAREQERAAWEIAAGHLKTALAEAQATARAQQEQVRMERDRALADLALRHEHQRSIWLLERDRLENTIAALEKTSRAKAARRRTRLALAAALLLAGTVGFALAHDLVAPADANGAGGWLQSLRAFSRSALPCPIVRLENDPSASPERPVYDASFGGPLRVLPDAGEQRGGEPNRG